MPSPRPHTVRVKSEQLSLILGYAYTLRNHYKNTRDELRADSPHRAWYQEEIDAITIAANSLRS